MNDFLHPAMLAFYDGNPPADDPPAGDPPADDPPAGGKTFTQEQVNKFLADDRRKHQERYTKLEQSYESRLQDTTLAQESREQLETELEGLRASFMTEKQQIEHEKKKQKEKYEGELTESRAAAEKYKGLYTDTVINQSIQDAAVKGEAFNAQQITGLLRPMTQLREQVGEDGKPTGDVAPMVEFPDVDESTGETVNTLRTPMDAVKRMKELPNQFGNLFRANVVSGVGQGAATGGVTPGQGGSIDVTKLSPEQYRKLRKENPAALGLRSRN